MVRRAHLVRFCAAHMMSMSLLMPGEQTALAQEPGARIRIDIPRGEFTSGARVTHLAVCDRNRIYLTLRQPSGVYEVSRSGISTRLLLETSEGEAQLRRPTEVGCLDGRLWVKDGSRGTIWWWYPGEVVSDESSFPPFGYRFIAPTLAGTFVGERNFPASFIARGLVDLVPVVEINPAHARIDTIATRAVGGSVLEARDTVDLSRATFLLNPYSLSSILAVSATTSAIVIVDQEVVGEGRGMITVSLYHPLSAPALVATIPFEPIVVSEEQQRSDFALRLGNTEILPREEEGPSFQAAVSDVLYGGGDLVLLAVPAKAGSNLQWEMIDVRRNLVKRLEVPRSFRALAVSNDTVWGVNEEGSSITILAYAISR